MVWVPHQYLSVGTGSGHMDRPSYSVTPAGRGMSYVVLPCTGEYPGRSERFFELWSICYRTFITPNGEELPEGDRPRSVYPRTWIHEVAEKLDYRVTGGLLTYVRLTSTAIGKPFAWWRERGSKILDAPPKPNRA
jgi:hypothetical protein